MSPWNDRYRRAETLHSNVTDDADGSDATAATGGTANGPTDGTGDAPVSEETPRGPRAASEVDFAELSIPQRVFVAAVQNPTRGVVIVALFAFAFSFYIAFWMVFPRIAAAFSVLALVVSVALGGVYYGFDRYVD